MNKNQNRLAESSPTKISSVFRNKKQILIKTLGVLIALALWQIISTCIPNLLFASPWQTAKSLLSLLGQGSFYATVWFTLCRILLGFFLAFVLGVLFALLAGRFYMAEQLLWPYMVTVKSVPVASFVAIAFLWLSSANVSVLISFLMALPIVYTNLLQGIKATDKKMLQMADLFKIPFLRRLRYIWLPSVKGYLLSGVSIAFGLAWKAGIAAELIGYPKGSVGGELYSAKQFLETADLFAWTVIIVLVSFITEKLISLLLKAVIKGVEK